RAGPRSPPPTTHPSKATASHVDPAWMVLRLPIRPLIITLTATSREPMGCPRPWRRSRWQGLEEVMGAGSLQGREARPPLRPSELSEAPGDVRGPRRHRPGRRSPFPKRVERPSYRSSAAGAALHNGLVRLATGAGGSLGSEGSSRLTGAAY